MAKLFASLDGGAGDYSQSKATRLPPVGGLDWRPRRDQSESAAVVSRSTAVRLHCEHGGTATAGERPANRERFDYWLNAFRYERALAQLGCTRGELDAAVQRIAKESAAARRQQCTRDEALPLRLALARQWEEMMTCLLQTVSTPGRTGHDCESGAACPAEHTRAALSGVARPAADEWAGAPLPPEAQPRGDYVGAPRLIVPTVRTVVREGESADLTVILLDNAAPQQAAVWWRPLGAVDFQQISLQRVGRGVHRVRLPAVDARALSITPGW